MTALTEATVEQAALAVLRDTLLPKLVSGEVRVKKEEGIQWT